mgnify:CR=1 FL=1
MASDGGIACFVVPAVIVGIAVVRGLLANKSSNGTVPGARPAQPPPRDCLETETIRDDDSGRARSSSATTGTRSGSHATPSAWRR